MNFDFQNLHKVLSQTVTYKHMKNKNQSSKFDFSSKILLSIAFISIIISFIAPIIFTQFSWIDFSGTGEIGDTLGGIMNPFIAIGGVLLTYLAFYMQFKANKLQRQQFEIQLEEDKNQFKQERKEQERQFSKNQFENQFYEMIRLHKENVKEIELEIKKITIHKDNKHIEQKFIKGRQVFAYFIEELKLLYYVSKKAYPEKKKDFLINKAYFVFFHGIKIYHNNVPNQNENPEELNYLKGISQILSRFDSFPLVYKNQINFDCKEHFDTTFLKHKLFLGHSSYLAHYYRHLYQTVKFIVSKEDNLIDYSDKRNYLRILRSQLSNQEQAMLFYNWKSKFGKNWENKENKFFTDYRMIHNIYDGLLFHDFKLKEIFDLDSSKILKEENRIDDSLFEFQNW